MKGYGFLREHSKVLNWCLRILDFTVLLGAALLSYWVVLDWWPMPLHYVLAIGLALFLSLAVYPAFSLYRAWRGIPRVDEFKTIVFALGSLFIMLAVLAFLTKTSESYSRLWFGVWLCGAITGMALFRLSLRSFLDYIREQGFNQRKIVIVGEGELSQKVAAQIQASPWYGLEVLGFFGDFQSLNNDVLRSRLNVLGTTDDLATYVEENSVDQVWLALSLDRAGTIREVLDGLKTSTVDVRYVPDIFSFSLLNHSMTEIAGMPVLNISSTPMEGSNRVLKAVEDRMLAFFIVLFVSPLMLLIAAAIKLSSPGPVFYRQQRVSWNGGTFEMMKFRTMPVDVEKSGVEWGGSHKKQTFPLGKFLRKTSLDELPQFLNVLMGQMSIVGPRPERPQFVAQFKHEIPGYMQKHMVKAGITGWAQINGWRGDTDLKKRIEHDLYYIENWSLWFDLKIIILTVFKGLIHKNAY